MNAHLFVIFHAGGKMLFGLRVKRFGHGYKQNKWLGKRSKWRQNHFLKRSMNSSKDKFSPLAVDGTGSSEDHSNEFQRTWRSFS
jgi:hypothetical protein